MQYQFHPTPKQKEAHRLLQNNRIVLYGGAIRGAKSYWGCMEIISLCFQYPKSRWLMLRRDRPVIEKNLLTTFRENFLEKGFSNYIKKFTQDDLTLTWINGSQILFMGENFDTDKDLNRFRGLEINGAFIDEVNEIQQQTLNKIIERAGSWFHSPGCPIKILMSCNPTNNWVKTRFYEPWKTGALPKGVAYIQAKITDNPYVSADYMEQVSMLPRYEYMQFVEGDWDVNLKMGGEFYKCFELDKHVGETKYDAALPLHISWDDNVNPYLSCAIFQLKGKEVRMVDEIAGINPGNTIKSVCNEFIRRYPAHNTGLFIYGDATANKEDTKLEKGYNFFRLITEALKQYRPQLRVLKSNPSVAMRGNWLNTVFEKELAGITVLVSPTCKKAVQDFVMLKEAADGCKLKEMETDSRTHARQQKYGHFTDCFDYMMCSAFANEFANYQAGGVIAGISYGRNTTSKNSY